METIAVLVGLGVFGVLILLPIWTVVSILQLRRKSEDNQRESAQHWQDLRARVHVLETQLKEARDAATAHPHAAEAQVATEARAAAPPAEPTHAVVTPAVVAPTSAPTLAPIAASTPTETRTSEVKAPEPIAPKAAPVAPKPTAPVPTTAALTTPAPVAPSLATHQPAPPPPPARPGAPQVAPPSRPETPQPAPVFARTAARGSDIEEKLGTNWLNKIGIGILVLGLAFFLAYQLQNLGPGGKVLLGLGLSAVMIAVGVRYESNERYRLLARASAAGGWALLYFVSYAVYHVPAAHIIDSQELDFFLMLAVAAAIVAYSLRYTSEATTALALFLSYLTVGIHHSSVFSLFASVLLAATVVTLALRMNWFTLELLGVIGTYFNHFLWMFPAVSALGSLRPDNPEFHTSIGMVGFYWLMFRGSYIYRKVDNAQEERLSTISALANGFGLLLMLHFHASDPTRAFPTVLTLGCVELALSALAARRRRAAFIVLATLGSILVVAAFPLRYSGANLSVLWLAAAEAFLLAGVFLEESVFRRIGMVTLVVVSAQMVFDTAASLLEIRLSNSPHVAPDLPTAVLFASAAALCYFNAHWVRERWPRLFEHEFDVLVSGGLTYLGGLLALLAAWLATPAMWTCVAWAVLALVLDAGAKKFGRALAVQGNLMALASLVRLVTLNLWSTETLDGTTNGLSLRLVTVGLTALLLYAAAPFAGGDEEGELELSWLTAAYTWAGSILVGGLLWLELNQQNVALGWMVLGLVLIEIGIQLKAGFLRWQGYTALGASFTAMLLLNLDVPAVGGGLSARMTHVAPLALAYAFADWRLRSAGKNELARAGTVFSYFAMITVAALLYFELAMAWVAAGWAAFALVMIAAAWGLKRRDYLNQSYLLCAAVGFQAISYNFLAVNIVQPLFAPHAAPVAGPWTTVGSAIALLFAGLGFAFAWRSSMAESSASEFALGNHPEQVFFFVPFGLLTTLIAFESKRGQLTVSWGVEGLVVFLFAVWVVVRSFRLAGLGLLLACVAKILLIDVWGLDLPSKIVTLIVLGVALLLVSFLYTRYEEKIRRYL